MAIELESIDFIVPIRVIREIYPGGWTQCLHDHRWIIGSRVWYDAHLFRDGAMGRSGIRELLDHWEDLGFAPTESRSGRITWNEVCVVEFSDEGLAIPCDWLAVNASRRTAHLEGRPPGRLAGRSSVGAMPALDRPGPRAPAMPAPGNGRRTRHPAART